MKAIRAEAMGMCFGVRRAIETALELPNPESVTILGQLVHNEEVTELLSSRGFQSCSEKDASAIPAPPKVLITAHGISDSRRKQLTDAGKALIDTTCPLVRRIHARAQQLQAEGYFILVIGRRGHVEVRGIVEDLDTCEVIESPDEVRAYQAPRLAVICQSTTPPRTALRVRKEIDFHNPGKEIKYVSTICRPTRDRQYAMLNLLKQVDAVVIVGGKNSNNTRQLVGLARAFHVPCVHIQNARELDPVWCSSFETVGLTAGTSTPDRTIEEVYQKLQSIESTSDSKPSQRVVRVA